MTRRLLTLLLCLATLLPCIALAQDQFKVLVVAIPNRYHHDYTVVAKPQFERMAQRHGVDLTWSWNSTPFDGDLSSYAAIVVVIGLVIVIVEQTPGIIVLVIREGRVSPLQPLQGGQGLRWQDGRQLRT